jgi:HAD superfamily hydrolase (TIGR01509 family)
MSLITFDFHNTLATCDTWFDLEVYSIASRVAADTESVAESSALDAHYRHIRTEVMRTGIEVSVADAVTTVFLDSGISMQRSQIDDSVDRLMRLALDDLSPTPGAIDTVTYLQKRGHTLGVISSAAHHEFVEWALATFGILDRFDFVLTSVRAGIYKSQPDLYLRALDSVGADARCSLHVGDSLKWDVETASRAGMRTAWLSGPQRHATDAVPDLTFDSLVDAGPAIDRFMRDLA